MLACGVRIFAFVRSKLSEPTAHSIQTVHTCAALAKAGATVALHADLGPTSPAEILRAYGAPSSPNLSIRDMGWRWHTVALPIVAGRLMGPSAPGTGPSILFLREVRPYALTLAGAAKRLGVRVAFEAHNAAGKMAAEKAGAEPAPGQALGPAAADHHDDHDHGDDHGHDHGHGHGDEEHSHGPGPALGIGKVGSRTAAATKTPVKEAAKPTPEEDPEEAAGRERARPKPDPKAIAAAAEREALETQILALADLVLAPQSLTLSALAGMIRPGVPSRHIPNGTMVPAALPAVTKDIDVLYMGSLSEWKGVESIVAAMQKLFPYRLTIVGGRSEADRKRLQQAALQLGVAPRVQILPPVPPAQVWEIYARAKVGVVPLSAAFLEAREYTCPVKLLEMMAAGLPIVTVRLPSVQELVADGKEVLMSATDTPDAYAVTIKRVLNDPALAARLSEGARAKAESFSFDARARAMMEAFAQARPSRSA